MIRELKAGLATCAHWMRLLASRKFRAMELSGALPGTETPLTVLYLGPHSELAPVNDYFDGNAQTRDLGGAHAFFQGRARRRWVTPEIDAVAATKVPGAEIQAGEFVTAALHVNLSLPGSMEELVGRLSETERRKVRQALKVGFEPEVAEGDDAYREFHEKMLTPLMTQRYGSKAWIVPLAKLRSQAGRSTLLFLKSAGRRVGGVHILWPKLGSSHSIPHFNKIGMIEELSGDPGQLNKLNFALYYHMFDSTIRRGHRAISLGIVPPLLNGGLFWFKARWGSDFVAGAHEMDFYRHTIAFCSAKKQEILQRRYLVHLEEGKLAATIGVKPEEAGTEALESMVKSRRFPSLARINLIYADGRTEER